MTTPQNDAPRAVPSRPKGSGSRAPWIVLALLIAAACLAVIAIIVAVLLFRA